MTSGTTVDAPQPSAQEQALLQSILDQLTEQQAYNDMMFPEYARQLGYKVVETAGTPYEYSEAEQSIIDQYKSVEAALPKAKQLMEQNSHDPGYWSDYQNLKKQYDTLKPQYDTLQQKASTYESKTGQTLEKMSDEEWYAGMTESEKRQYDLTKETQTRQLAALRGELPLTQTLQDQKAAEFEQLKGTYGITGNTVDTAVANDTIGTQNLSEFKKRWNALEEQERYGQLSSGTAATVAQTGLASDITNRNIGALSSLGGQNAGITQGYYSLLNPYMAYTQAGYQAQAQNASTQTQIYGSLLGLAGMLGGAYLGGPAGAMAGAYAGSQAGNQLQSSKNYKKNIKTKTKKDEDKALKDVVKTRSVEYRYKDKMGLGRGKRLGAIAEEVPRGISALGGKAIDLGDKLELVSMAVKSLARKVDKLEA